MVNIDVYYEQLCKGCGKTNCINVFCNKNGLETPKEEIAVFLNNYEDLFLCKNISKLLNNEICLKEYKNQDIWYMNLFFECISSLCTIKSSDDALNNSKSRILRFQKNKEQYKKRDIRKENMQNNCGTEDNKHFSKEQSVDTVNMCNIEHFYCCNLNCTKTNISDKFFINCIIELLMRKHERCADYNLGLIIVRLFAAFGSYTNSNTYCFLRLFVILNNICRIETKRYNCKRTKAQNSVVANGGCNKLNKKETERAATSKDSKTNLINLKPSGDELTNESINVIFEEETLEDNRNLVVYSLINDSQQSNNNILEAKNKKNDKNQYWFLCLSKQEFAKNDLYRLFSTFHNILNKITNVNVRENRKFELILNIYEILFIINDKFDVFVPKKFYLHKLCSRVNVKEEYKFYRTRGKTILTYSFVLPVHIKAELLKLENNDLMKSSLQDSFFRSLFEGHVEPYLFITVDRNNIYADSLELLQKIRYEDFHKQLRITFKGEEGVDSGGIRKEYFQLLSYEMKHDEKIFDIKDHTIWFKIDCNLTEKYYTIGKIIGIALYNNVVLNLPFPSFFFKKLLNRKTCLADLREIDKKLYLSLYNLKNLSADEILELELSFKIVYIASNGNPVEHNLDECNQFKQVTIENVNIFVNRYADLFLNKLIEKQFNATKEGFFFVINKKILSDIRPKELEKIIFGSNRFNINEIKSTATYDGYDENSMIIKYFWEIFEAYDRKMKKKLLQFITGHDRIAVGGSGSIKLIIMKNGCDTDRLPSSQTCFNTLLLPEYSSKEKLESKLKTALELTAGFFLL